MRSLFLIATLILVVALVASRFEISKGVLSEADDVTDGYHAEVRAALRFPFFSNYSASLVVSKGGTVVWNVELLAARDAVEDLKLEFQSLEWDHGSLRIRSQQNHYRGPTVFVFKSGP